MARATHSWLRYCQLIKLKRQRQQYILVLRVRHMVVRVLACTCAIEIVSVSCRSLRSARAYAGLVRGMPRTGLCFAAYAPRVVALRNQVSPHLCGPQKKIDHTYARQSCGAELCFVSHSGDDSFIIFTARAQTHSGRYGTRTR